MASGQASHQNRKPSKSFAHKSPSFELHYSSIEQINITSPKHQADQQEFGVDREPNYMLVLEYHGFLDSGSG